MEPYWEDTNGALGFIDDKCVDVHGFYEGLHPTFRVTAFE